jgi:hypothetical protein
MELDPLFSVELELVVQLQATHLRKVVAFGVEEQVVEEVRGRVDRRRVPGTQASVDLDDRLVLGHGLVREQRVPDRRPGRDRIQEEQWELQDAPGLEVVEVGLRDLLVALDDDLAGLFVDDVHGSDPLDRIDPDQIILGDLNPLQPGLADLANRRLRELLVLANEHVPGVVLDLSGAALADQVLGRGLLEDLPPIELDGLARVEELEKVLGLVAEGLQQNSDVDLPTSIDAGEDEVLVVVLDVQPGSPIGDHPAGVDLLAGRTRGRRERGVVEDAGRAMQLGDDDAFGSVDDEGAVVGHDRDLPEVDLLLLHVPNRLRAFRIVPGDETDGDLEGCGVRHASMETFLHVVLRLLQRVTHELQRSGVVEVADGEHGVEHGLQARILPFLHLDVGLQEAVEGQLLDLEQIRDVDDPRNARKGLSDSRGELGELGLRHE